MAVENALSSSQIAVNKAQLPLIAAKVNETVTGIVQRWSEITNKGYEIGNQAASTERQSLVDQFNIDNHTADQIIGVAKVAAGAAILKK